MFKTIEIPLQSQPENDKQAIVLNHLLCQTASTHEHQMGYWINVHTDDWRRLIGGEYRSILEDLDLHDLIEINESYSTGRNSKSYRLSERLRRPEIRSYDLQRPHRLNRIRIAEDDQVGLALVKCFDRIELPPQTEGWDGFHTRQIRSGAYYATRCQYGRFHSSFTGLKKETRRTLRTVWGDPLFEVDVKNCQPLLLGVLAARSQNEPDLRLVVSQAPNSLIIDNSLNTTNQSNHHQYTICCITRDLRDYLNLCADGHIYEHLVRQCQDRLTIWDCIPPKDRHRHAKDRPLTRTDIKESMIVMLFNTVEKTKKMPLFELFGELFPSVADFILAAKQEQYQHLAHNCHRFESNLMIDSVCGTLLEQQPELTLLTIHDAVMTTPDHVESVQDQIRREFQLQCGVVPQLKVTSSCPLE